MMELKLYNCGLYLKDRNGRASSNKPLNGSGNSIHGCPLDKDELGRSTWNLLHTMAATYPEKPSESQKEDIKKFFGVLSRSYPCEFCAKDLGQE